ncbi:S8 family serine peptidase [Acidimicrobiaceae bacterium]|nr:S8 family serine peptidase [Acidimicrobiaceae bacterium]
MQIGNRGLYVLLTLGVLAAVWAIPSSVVGAETVLSDETSLLEMTTNEDSSLLGELSISAEGQELLASGYTPGEAATKIAKEELLEDPSLSRNPFGLIVQFEHALTDEEINEVLAPIGGVLVGKAVADGSTYLIETLYELESVLTVLESDSRIKSAEFDEVLQISDLPNDPDLGQLWGMNSTYGIDAPGAWAQTLGDSSVVVAVIDTGIDLDHPDLVDNLWTNSDEIPGNGIDDDSNGFIDDIHGWDFVNNDGNPDDDNNHGTHVAGTIAASANSIGVVGVAPGVQVMGLKFLNSSGSGMTSHALQALQYAIDNGALISNNSWGGGGFSSAMETLLTQAEAVNHVFVAAAGNASTNIDSYPTYPAAYQNSNVISVASIKSDGSQSSFSNYGTSNVDVAAPGSGIRSTITGGGYASFNGTSMASPHVAGIVSLMRSLAPTVSTTDIKRILIETSTWDSRLENVSDSEGRVSASAAVSAVNGSIPSLSITSNATVVTEGDTVVFSATATDSSNNNLSGQVVWKIGDAVQTTGATFTYTASTPGQVRVRAQVTDSSGTASTFINLTVNEIERSITVTSPNGGEIYDPGDTKQITWNHVGPTGPVDVTVIEKQTVSGEFLGESALPIVDHTVLTIPLDVTSTAAISSLSVGLRFNHTWDADLLIELVNPSGQTIQLANHVGNSGDNFGSGAESCSGQLTVFADTAETSILYGSAPFAGTYKPQQLLSAFSGQNPAGQWKIKINDQWTYDQGELFCAQLTFNGTSTAVAADIPVANGTVSWTVPASLAGKNLIARVDSGLAFDESNSAFTVSGGGSPAPTTTTTTTTTTQPPIEIEVVSPNGGEIYEHDASVPISWTVTGQEPLTIFAHSVNKAPKELGNSSPIEDHQTLLIPIQIPDSGTVQEVSLGLRADHTWMSDLTVSLRHPDGTTVVLMDREGSSGDNFGTGSKDCLGQMTVFDDDAQTPVIDGSAPYLGNFIPEEILSTFEGLATAGTWYIEIKDSFGMDQGNVFCVDLEVAGNGVQIAVDQTAPLSISAATFGSGSYLVRAATSNGASEDFSDSSFTINPAPFDASDSFPAEEVEEYEVTVNYSQEEMTNLTDSANFFNMNVEDFQLTAVGLLAFLRALLPSGTGDWSPICTDCGGSEGVTTLYVASEGTQSALESVAGSSMTGAQAQRFSSSVLIFLIAILNAQS